MIQIKNLSKSYGKLKVLDGIDLEISEGEFVVLFGPNGCGKTTLLNILAGLEDYKGSIVKNRELKCSFVFQNYYDSLFPWRNVYDNIMLTTSDHGKSEELIQQLNLGNFLYNFPYELSGGMQQKVAIARAFSVKPDLMLLDEPFSSLDHNTSNSLIVDFMNLWNNEKMTVLFVSHNIDEAILLADKLVILSRGPSKIKTKININLPRPRSIEMIYTKEFLKLKSNILELIKNEENF